MRASHSFQLSVISPGCNCSAVSLVSLMRRKDPAASSSGPTSMQLKMGLLRYSALGSSLIREILVITGFMVIVLLVVMVS